MNSIPSEQASTGTSEKKESEKALSESGGGKESLVEHEVRCYCGETMRLRRAGKFGPFYGCPDYPRCDGIIGCHPNGKPLGIPAPQSVRNARIKAHAAFDAFWKAKGWGRKQAYRWLGEVMNLDKDHAHIAMFSADQCGELVPILARNPASTTSGKASFDEPEVSL